jgi:hypothetical protein
MGLGAYGVVAIVVGAALHDGLWRNGGDKHHTDGVVQATIDQT